VQHDTSPPSAPLAFFTFTMLLAPVTNWEPHGVMLAGYGMRVQNESVYCVSHLQRYGVMVHGNVTSVYVPLERNPMTPTKQNYNVPSNKLTCLPFAKSQSS
jgi:hypothetical protein